MKQFDEFLFEEELIQEMGSEIDVSGYTIPTKALYKLFKEVKDWKSFLKRIKARAKKLDNEGERRLKAIYGQFEKGMKFHLMGMEWR